MAHEIAAPRRVGVRNDRRVEGNHPHPSMKSGQALNPLPSRERRIKLNMNSTRKQTRARMAESYEG